MVENGCTVSHQSVYLLMVIWQYVYGLFWGACDPGLNDMQKKKIILRLFFDRYCHTSHYFRCNSNFCISFSLKNKFKNDNNVIFVGCGEDWVFLERPAGLSCTKAPLSLTVKSCGHYTGAFHGRSGHPNSLFHYSDALCVCYQFTHPPILYKSAHLVYFKRSRFASNILLMHLTT